MQLHGRRWRQIACLVHVMVAGAGAAALGTARDLSGPGAARYLALFALGVLAVLHVLHPGWPAARPRLTAWACGLIVVACAAALRWTHSPSARLGSIVVSACCLGSTLNAAACVWLWGPSGPGARRFSKRIGFALFVGLLGLFPAIAFRQSQALLPALLAVACLGSLAGGASELEAALQSRDLPRAARLAGQLLTGIWIGLAAIAAASVAVSAATLQAAFEGSRGEGWATALQAARLGWLHTFPLVGAVLVVFAGRLQVAGLAARPSLSGWLWVLAVTGAGVAGARRELLRGDPSAPRTAVIERAPATAVTSRPAERAAAASPPAPTTSAGAPLAAPSAGESESAAAPPGPQASAEAGAPPVATGEALVIESLETTGMLAADARSGLDRRFKLLSECLETNSIPEPGTLSLRAFLDGAGSVRNVQPAGGNLENTPFAACAMLAFYRMGFASQGAPASFQVTLRAARKP